MQMDAALKLKGLAHSFRGVDVVLASDSLRAVELRRGRGPTVSPGSLLSSPQQRRGKTPTKSHSADI